MFGSVSLCLVEECDYYDLLPLLATNHLIISKLIADLAFVNSPLYKLVLQLQLSGGLGRMVLMLGLRTLRL